MKKTKFPIRAVGVAASALLLVAFTGCTTYVSRPAPPVVMMPSPPPPPPPPVIEEQPVMVAPPPVIVAPPAETTVVVIRTESDFYQPLSPYGEWVEVPGFGRCWKPVQVVNTWRPYANGHWDRTDAGWYWNSDEPWAWATYHYGRWDFSAQYGWVWIPQTQWAPAWVSWREGAGYVGWAPLPPAARFHDNVMDAHAPAHATRDFVFVPEQHMMEPVRAKTVIVNNTTIINQTVNITNVRVENKTVINEGPRVQEIERRSGRQLPTTRANDLRHRDETAVLTRQRNVTPARDERPPETSRPVISRPVMPANPPQREVRQPEPLRTPEPPQVSGRQNDNRPPVVQNPPVHQVPELRRPEPVVVARPVETPPVETRPMNPTPNPVVTRPVPPRPESRSASVVIPQPPVARPPQPHVESQAAAVRPAPPTVIAPPARTVPVRTAPGQPGRGEPPAVVKRPEVRPEPAPQNSRPPLNRKAVEQQTRNQPHTPAKKPGVVLPHGTNVVVTPGQNPDATTNAPEQRLPETRGPRRR